MTSRTRNSFIALPGAALLLAAALVVGPTAVASAHDEDQQSSGRSLEGTWWVQVALVDCASRTPLLSFPALLTFAEGGTMTGTTTNPAFAVGQRTPDHGRWSRKWASRSFKASSVALLQFTTPAFKAGAQRLDQTITLTDSDHFKSDAVTGFYDAAGVLYREGCAMAAGARLK